MREEIRKFHLDALSAHNSILFDTLVYPSNLITDTMKIYTFRDQNNSELMPKRGYLAIKEVNSKKHIYFIDENFFDAMPLRMNNCEEFYLRESPTKKLVILRSLNPTPFRITPEKTFTDVKTFIDEIIPFEHTNPLHWKILKICAIMGYVGKIFIGISSPSELGKSSAFRFINSITSKSIVFRPRTPAGLLLQINEDGNIVFDEIQKANKETLLLTEEFAQMVADGSPQYVNGAKKSKDLKQIYNTVNQSITFLYNTKDYYQNANTDFFDNVWVNPVALDTKLLKLKFEGRLTERFDKNFDVYKTAEDNKMYYLRIAKMLLWLKEQKASNQYQRRFNYPDIELKGRHQLIYDELTWLIDLYSENYEEYVILISALNKCIFDYKKMVGTMPIEKQEELK